MAISSDTNSHFMRRLLQLSPSIVWNPPKFLNFKYELYSTNYHWFQVSKKKGSLNLLHRWLSVLPLQLIHIIKRKHQILQASSSNPPGQVPLPNQPKHPLPHWTRRLPRIPLQEKLSQTQFQHILPQKPQPRMRGPDVPGIGPLTGGMLKRHVQQSVELLCWVVVLEPIRRLQRVPKSLLGLQQVLPYPRLVGIVEPRRGQAGTE